MISRPAGEKLLLRPFQRRCLQCFHADAYNRCVEPEPFQFQTQQIADLPGVGGRFAKPNRHVMPGLFLRDELAAEMASPQLRSLQKAGKALKQKRPPLLDGLRTLYAIFEKLLDLKFRDRAARDDKFLQLAG